jgi:predicted nucleic acid-binding protein
MSYLVDTDRVASYLNGRPDAVTLLSSLRQDGLEISIITYGEIYDGIYASNDPRSKEASFLQFLRRVEVLPLTRTVMKRFARIRGQLRRQGQIIGDPDILIAATALQYDLTLVTRNLRHFGRISELSIYQES